MKNSCSEVNLYGTISGTVQKLLKVKVFLMGWLAGINFYDQHFVKSYILSFTFKGKWLGIMHHVCGEHEWNGGTCSHGPLTEVEGGKEYLAMNSKATEELRKIVLDREWLKSLEHYVLFRYILGRTVFDNSTLPSHFLIFKPTPSQFNKLIPFS